MNISENIIDNNLMDSQLMDNQLNNNDVKKNIYALYKKTNDYRHINRIIFTYNTIVSDLHAAIITRQPDFSIELYKKIVKTKEKDIEDMNTNDLIKHYICFRKLNGVINFAMYDQLFKINNNFDLDIYKNMNADLFAYNDMELINHYVKYGVYECRITCNNDTISKKKEFYKTMFRRICTAYIPSSRKYKLLSIQQGSNLEAVFIEFRILPHIEFLIRNAILQLGEKWSHTVVCGNLNYDHMVRICSSIDKNIKIIKLEYDNLVVKQYNVLLTSAFFWNLLIGEKILIYQE
jgi:hypothetical protein